MQAELGAQPQDVDLVPAVDNEAHIGGGREKVGSIGDKTGPLYAGELWVESELQVNVTEKLEHQFSRLLCCVCLFSWCLPVDDDPAEHHVGPDLGVQIKLPQLALLHHASYRSKTRVRA